MSIKANISQMQGKAVHAASLASQLGDKASEVNGVFGRLDDQVKARQCIGSSILSLQRRLEQAQQRMSDISSFLTNAAERYNRTEATVVAKGAAISAITASVAGAPAGAINVGAGTGAAQSKVEGKKWYESNWFKVAVGAVVVGAAIAAAVTVGGPILVAAAVGAVVGGAVGALTGGVISSMNGGSFADGAADGFMWGALGGAVSGGIGATGIGIVGAAAAEGTVNSAIYAGQTLQNGGHVTVAGVATNFVVGAGFSALGTVASNKISGMVAKNAVKNADDAVKVADNAVISEADRIKINNWKFKPDDDLYLKYKQVYDDPKYFNQSTGDAIYPGTNGDVNIDGFLNGKYDITALKEGKIIDRYGSNGSGRYFSPDGSSFESRALPPYMEGQKYTRYMIIKDFDAKSGTIAPWFGQDGMGTQFFTDIKILNFDGDYVDATVQNLLEYGYIEEITP